MNLTQRYPRLLAALSHFPVPVAVLDLESTGGHFQHDRVTEVALLHFHQGRIQTFHSLVNPARPIPPFIEQLTGISNAMVADAPHFGDLLPELLPLLRGSLLLAHNSRFDYTFLRHECARTDTAFAAATLCTVQLSRKLYPQDFKHNLEAIIARHHIQTASRHRALDDVLALCDFLEISLGEQEAGHWQQTAGNLIRPGLLPDWLPSGLRQNILSLPDSHGLSIWHHPGHQQAQLFVHEHAFSEVHGLLQQPGAADRWQDTRHIEFLPSAGSLHNMVLLAEYLHRHKLPAGGLSEYRSIRWQHEQGYLKAQVVPLENGFYDTAPTGLFLHPKSAKRALNHWAQQHRLCPALLGILPDGHAAACPLQALRRCHPDCDTQHQDADILRHAASLPVCDWGQASSVLITEQAPFSRQPHTFRCRGGAVEWAAGQWFFDSRIPKLVKARLKQRDRHTVIEERSV